MRPVRRVERALLADDGEQHGVINAGTDRRVARHADGRKCVVVERQAARQRRLAQVQHPARILLLLGQFAEGGERTDIVELAAEVGHQRNDQRGLLERVEDFNCANELEPFDLGELVRLCGRRSERKRRKAKARARQLPVIGGR